MQNVPNSEIVRIVSYLAGFMLGVVAVAMAIYVIVTDPERMELFGVLVGLGLSLMGMGGLATYNVPSVKPQKPKQAEPVPAIASDPGLVERATTGEMDTVVVDPIELTRNPESDRRGDPGVVYMPEHGRKDPTAEQYRKAFLPDFKGEPLPNSNLRGRYGKHE